MTDRKRDEAKLDAAIAALRPILAAASEAAHALVPKDPEEAGFDRIVHLGLLAAKIGDLCGPSARIVDGVIDTRSRSSTARIGQARRTEPASQPRERRVRVGTMMLVFQRYTDRPHAARFLLAIRRSRKVARVVISADDPKCFPHRNWKRADRGSY
jgi:hypothetical protein